jgi:hypothetical protein
MDDKLALHFVLSADPDWVLIALKLLKRFEKLPEGFAPVCFENDVFRAVGTGEVRILLKPSQSLVDLVSTLGTRKVEGCVG